jgi:GNAT superfamily N-acetyltransferase
MCGGHVFKAGARKPMEIRRIRADEGLRLRALRLRALGDSPTAYGSTLASEELYPESIWHERAASGAAGDKVVTIVAEHDNRLLGMATGLAAGSPTHDELNPTMVAVFVDGTVRQQGVGVGLVEKVIDWAKARGSARLFVWITSGNEPAVALYRRCGFRVTGATRPNAHTSTLVECEMLLDLCANECTP